MTNYASPTSRHGLRLGLRLGPQVGLSLGLLLLFTPGAQAHDNLPASWCLDPNTVPTVSSQFSFTPEMLEKYRRANPEPEIPTGDCDTADRSCGIVDEWHYANQMSLAFCGGAESNAAQNTLPTDRPMPFVSSPEHFNAREHHDLYRFRDGNLVGACIVCVAKPEAPTPMPNEPPAQ